MTRIHYVVLLLAAMCCTTSCSDPETLSPPMVARNYVLYDQAVEGMTFPVKTDDFDIKWMHQGYPTTIEWYASFHWNVLRADKSTDQVLLHKLITEVRTQRLERLEQYIKRNKGTVRYCEFAIFRESEVDRLERRPESRVYHWHNCDFREIV
ncbi:MAG: hypothetical protein JWM11_6988 [Planctomycetaceae bacterium]|nr:hypothetical protein [Planctomycetaceae bacterium]